LLSSERNLGSRMDGKPEWLSDPSNSADDVENSMTYSLVITGRR